MIRQLGHEADDGHWVLPKRLRRGLREALDAGHGRLRMDPQDLANLLGAAIDREVERLGRIREEREQQQRTQRMLKQDE